MHCIQLVNIPQYVQCKRIAVYLSMSDEVEMNGLLTQIFSDNKLCFIPQYEKDDMRMLQLHSLSDYDELPMTKWNIKQPKIGDTNRTDPLLSGKCCTDPLHRFTCCLGGIDLVVVPGLGFTGGGKRLGRGKGYYDRFMKAAVERCMEKDWPKPYFVALAFHEQIVADIPTNDDDFVIDDVIVE